VEAKEPTVDPDIVKALKILRDFYTEDTKDDSADDECEKTHTEVALYVLRQIRRARDISSRRSNDVKELEKRVEELEIALETDTPPDNETD
jgi:iron uptake system EfeUOB component EfeO/EfeM